VCDLETSRMGAPYIYDISRLRVNGPVSNQMKLAYYTCVYLTCLLPIYACVSNRVLTVLARAYIIYEFSFSSCTLYFHTISPFL